MSYSTVKEMVEEALEVIDDPSVNQDKILKYFNRCLNRIAVKISIPDLDTVALVKTTAVVQTASTISFVNSSPAVINDSGDGFLTAGHSPGSTITINPTNDDTVLNSGSFTIDTVISGVITLIAGDVLVDESEGTSFDLNSFSNSLSLPSNFHKNIYKCYSITQSEFIKTFKNRRLVDRNFFNQQFNGNLEAVANIGKKLYYQKIPTTPESLRIYYFKKPEDLLINHEEGDIQFPDYIPDGILDQLLIHYAAYNCYNIIEDGMEGNKVNTTSNKNDFLEALSELYSHYGVEQEEPEDIPQEFDFNSLA